MFSNNDCFLFIPGCIFFSHPNNEIGMQLTVAGGWRVVVALQWHFLGLQNFGYYYSGLTGAKSNPDILINKPLKGQLRNEHCKWNDLSDCFVRMLWEDWHLWGRPKNCQHEMNLKTIEEGSWWHRGWWCKCEKKWTSITQVTLTKSLRIP